MGGLNPWHKGLNLRIHRVKAATLLHAFVLCLFAGLMVPNPAAAQDTDRDGLSYALELEFGSDPTRVDSDGDFLTDRCGATLAPTRMQPIRTATDCPTLQIRIHGTFRS